MKKNVVMILILMACLITLDSYSQWTWTPQTGRFINIKRMPKETAELQVEYARSLFLQGDLKKALKETEKFINFYGQDPLADQNLFLRGEIKMAMGKWLESAKEFQKLVSNYPDSKLYEQAIKKQYEIGDKLYEKGLKKRSKWFSIFKGKPLKQAIEVYSMVVNNQPFMPGAAEAQYKIGLCHQARKEYIEATYEYRRVIENYSQSDWVDDARYSLAKCYYDSSLKPIYDQSRAELAVDAIDEFIRNFPEDSRCAELKEWRSKMRENIAEQKMIVARFYEKQREFDSARIYYQLVATKYSDTSFAEKANRWLEENPAKTSELRAQFEQETSKQ
ncbi:MAG TPA: outer membrane protein assembly factor BamD [Candidatus Hydrogenedens sp.]|nr:outer membrane protein assembly factor BamD [Candidatus Hydrogenedens sp.]HOK10524.1 outer membrane protein assembly factor BamD [Candidatus Hydrogenedens sp.]HOL21003.1 outer membrane protein assembly factor BamD [Candidatus Hydrogenedens sp.]HPP59964.1 outer membrane protein assembly factor BamD [Candidatus Hydrogenedens sp.]